MSHIAVFSRSAIIFHGVESPASRRFKEFENLEDDAAGEDDSRDVADNFASTRFTVDNVVEFLAPSRERPYLL